MVRYIAKRLILAVITLMLISILTFLLMKQVPGGPFLSEKAPSAATTAALEAKYGLDKPLAEQYITYIGGVLKGDFGPSIKKRGKNVSDIISEGFPVSARIGGLALAGAVVVGIPLGALAALKRGKWIDNVAIVIATVGISVPGFIVATLLLLTVGMALKLTFGLETWAHYMLPAVALSFGPMANITRFTRSSMLDVLGQDYMRTAKAKGLAQAFVLFKHALRNAVLPVITYLGPALAYTLTGSFAVERIFTIPGLGNEFVSSIVNRDYPMIMGTTLFLSILIISMNVLVDIVYKIVDPRITFK